MSQRESETRRITLQLSVDLLGRIDALKPEWGLRGRGAVVERLLNELFALDEDEDSASQGAESIDQGANAAPEPLNDNTAIVLIHSSLVPTQDQDWESDEIYEPGFRPPGRGRVSGIELPGFVRQQSQQLRRSLEVPRTPPEPERGLALISADDLAAAVQRASSHWLQIYGQAPTDQVLEASMVWLARDVWPQSDHSDGRPFTWSLAQQVLSSFTTAWPDGEARFERVKVAAGILEDPFSGNTLEVRIPTLITRFVQRHRSRQKRAPSFQAIDQGMTVHAALKLLQLPTVADRPTTLKEVREAYREQAQCHHPDAGGSADAMRRLNEAYQFLKERYRRAN